MVVCRNCADMHCDCEFGLSSRTLSRGSEPCIYHPGKRRDFTMNVSDSTNLRSSTLWIVGSIGTLVRYRFGQMMGHHFGQMTGHHFGQMMDHHFGQMTDHHFGQIADLLEYQLDGTFHRPPSLEFRGVSSALPLSSSESIKAHRRRLFVSTV